MKCCENCHDLEKCEMYGGCWNPPAKEKPLGPPDAAGSMLNAYQSYIERFPWKRDEVTYEKWILSNAIESVAYRQGWADRGGNLNSPQND